MTVKQYLKDRKTRGIVLVTQIITGDRPVVRLRETWFHPQGGGQKADRGLIGSSHVIHVAHNGEYVDHYVDSLVGIEVGHEYPFVVDGPWRHLNMVYHSAGHLLASLVESNYPGLTAVSGHQWPGEARVEFDGSTSFGVSAEEIDRLLCAAIEKDIEVTISGDPFADRAIKIGEYKEIPCGGTHVRSLREIAEVHVTGLKSKGGRLRISYEATPAN